MTLLRYFFGTIWVLFVWLMVAVVVGFIILLVFPPSGGDNVVIGIGLDWRNLPGTILGFFAARQSWRTHVRRPTQMPAQTTPNEPGSV
jgi:hypothetical protein